MTPGAMLLLMLLGHFVADFPLQLCGKTNMADLKQKAWWDAQTKDLPPEKAARYSRDYRVGLICHALMWSAAVCLPAAWSVNGNVLFWMVWFNYLVHDYVDDAKCNEMRLSLAADQAIHLAQVAATWLVWRFCAC